MLRLSNYAMGGLIFGESTREQEGRKKSNDLFFDAILFHTWVEFKPFLSDSSKDLL